jgi:hypothetical protein
MSVSGHHNGCAPSYYRYLDVAQCIALAIMTIETNELVMGTLPKRILHEARLLPFYQAVLACVLVISLLNIGSSGLLFPPVSETQSTKTRATIRVATTTVNISSSSSGSSSSRSVQSEEPSNNVNVTVPEQDGILDIISVGSRLKAAHQTAQHDTFGQHAAVRRFFRFTEDDDSDRDCSSTLTAAAIDQVVEHCRQGKSGESRIAFLYRQYQFKPKKHVGWLCAQKRPIDGLYAVLSRYQRENMENVPQYLAIIDDDTFLNVPALMETLRRDFASTVPHVVAGCNTRMYAFTFPYGGFGSFLSRAAIQRLLKPIHCTTTTTTTTTTTHIADPFTRLACWRLQLNEMGERPFFRDGMSVGDLMYRYASDQPYSNVANWTWGYCLHSDHVLGYFLTSYHVSVPDSELKSNLSPNDSYRKNFKYTALTSAYHEGRQGECAHEREACTVDHVVCHYIEPDVMQALYHNTTFTIRST